MPVPRPAGDDDDGAGHEAATGALLEIYQRPRWTLSARLDGDALEFTLGDGQRLLRRARREARLLERAGAAMSVAELLGDDLGDRLAGSPPRVLTIQVDAELDRVAWESLALGETPLAAHFIVARQLVSQAEPGPPPAAGLAEALQVVVVQASPMRPDPAARRWSIDALDQAQARDAVAAAHVLVLEDVGAAELLARAALPRRERLLILRGPQPAGELAAALDDEATLLRLGDGTETPANAEAIDTVLLRLGSGGSIGEAIRGLYRQAGPGFAGRLYGAPERCFVRRPTATSRRQVTSLSFDIAGSTRLLQRIGDEAYAEMLNHLHACCTAVVRRHGGRPDDPQGDDGVMCYFGHPTALENAAVQAVEAGLEIVRTVSEMGITVRVGIATGLVAIRSDQPVGLSIHLAARLQRATAPGTVATAGTTRRLVAHAFEVEQVVEPLELKGFEAEEQMFVVLRALRDADAHRLERLPSLTPLVGRDDELARLHACWQRIRAGGHQLAVVSAEAGMGKSRLVRDFRLQLVTAGVRVLECRCRPDASASPYLALAEALRRWLAIGPGDTGGEALARLASALPEGAREGEPLALMAGLLGLNVPPSPPSAAGAGAASVPPAAPLPAPRGRRHRLLALLLDGFAAFAHHRTFCLLIEDWHWVDPSTREFVERLLEQPNGRGSLVLLTVRGAARSVLPEHRPREHIELGGLPLGQAREFVRLAGADLAWPEWLVRRLVERADGVPLFLEEAVRMALEVGLDRLEADVNALETVPSSLQDLLMARLDGLGAARQVAQVAAVVGREFTLSPLTALVETGAFGLDAATLAERLELLLQSGLVASRGAGRYAFKHALIRDAAYASLWTRDRQALHARMVVLLQERWPELAAAQPELLALHQTEAGLHRAALAQWERAASNAASRSAELEAIAHLRQALAVLARIEPGAEHDRIALRLQLLLAARLIATEGYGAEAVLQAYLESQRLCDRLGDETARFKVEMGLEAYRFMRADFGPSLEHGRRAAGIAAQSGDRKQRLQSHWGVACTLFHQGRLRATMREMEAALALYEPALHGRFGIQDPGLMCMAYSSWGLWELGRPDAALQRIGAAIAIAEATGHQFSLAVALAYAVSIELLRGETEAALRRVAACIRVCEESGFPVWLAIARCMRGRLLCESGQFDLGIGEMRAGYALWLSTGAKVSQPLYLALQAEGLMLAGDFDAAAACVEVALPLIDDYGERQLEAELTRLHGELAWRRGDVAAAERSLKIAYALAIRQHRLGFALRAATSLARLWAEDGREARARRILVPLLARWQEGHATRDLREAKALADALA